MKDAVLTLPRRLIQQVFHHAQAAPEGRASGLIAEAANGVLRPLSLAAGTSAGEQAAQLRERGERLFAVYHVHPQGPRGPLAEEYAPDSEHYVFIISLDTRGVLQLHAWRGSEELPAKIIED